MNLVRYRPTGLDLFDSASLFDRFFAEPVWHKRVPAVDVREDAESYQLEVELPGLKEQDIEVTVEDNLLTISSKQDAQKEDKKDGYLIKERLSSAFSRSFQLPKDVNREKIDGSFKSGLLSVVLPKTAAAKPKKVAIKAN